MVLLIELLRKVLTKNDIEEVCFVFSSNNILVILCNYVIMQIVIVWFQCRSSFSFPIN